MRRFIVVLFVIGLAGYLYWRSETGFKGPPGREPAVTFESVGIDSGRGNLLAIQPFLFPQDYASARSFEEKLDGSLQIAQRRGALTQGTVVVLPEYLGTWLVASEEKSLVYESETVAQALTWLVLRHPVDFLRYYLLSDEMEKDRAALFRLKAEGMARIYQSVFRTLASRYKVTLVAGSIVLPGPEVKDGELIVHLHDRLYNVSALFHPDGSIDARLIRKIFPIVEEQGFIASGDQEELPVFETPAGRLGVLVCADSWYPGPYRQLVEKGAEIVVIPSYSSPDSLWQTPWKGYNGGPFPDDVDRGDVGGITEGEAWKKYAMCRRAAGVGIRQGINVFLRGKLWDLGSDGHTLYLMDGAPGESESTGGASILNLWL